MRASFREVLAVSLFTNLLAMVVPLFTMQVYDRVVAHNGLATLFALASGVLLALGFDFVLRQTRSRLLQAVALRIDAALGQRLYEAITRLPLKELEARPAAHWQQVFADLQMVRTLIAGSTAMLMADLPFALLFVLVLFLVAPSVAWWLLLIVPAFGALAWVSARNSEHGAAIEHGKQLARDRWLMELWAGRAVAKALGVFPHAQTKFEALHADAIRFAAARGAGVDRTVALGQTLSLFTTVALVSSGAIAILGQSLTSGALVAATMLTSRILMPCNQLVSSWKMIWQSVQAAERLGLLLSQPGEVQQGMIDHPRPTGRLTCERVHYAYASGRPPVLDEVSLDLSPGQMVGLMGRNGSGKSTLLKMLQGLYTPTEGRVLIDGADIRQFGRVELARWIGYVPQESVLFSGTLRDNIALAHPAATDEDILRAATLAGAAAFIADLPDGYGTEVGEGGMRLSGGLRQRVAIARALIHDPAVLLCDEPTSNLDSEAEVALRQRLADLAVERLVVVATHSLPLLHTCHRLVLLDHGRIVMGGPAQEVLRKLLRSVPAQVQAGGQG